jgi:hypothetical protein
MNNTRPMIEMFFQDRLTVCRRATLGMPASPGKGLMVLPPSCGDGSSFGAGEAWA